MKEILLKYENLVSNSTNRFKFEKLEEKKEIVEKKREEEKESDKAAETSL